MKTSLESLKMVFFDTDFVCSVFLEAKLTKQDYIGCVDAKKNQTKTCNQNLICICHHVLYCLCLWFQCFFMGTFSSHAAC